MSFQNNAAWHCFSFEKEASCNVSTISKSSRPSLTALSKSVINLLLKGTQGGIVPDPVEVMVYCSAPEKQWERGGFLFVEVVVNCPGSGCSKLWLS